MSRFRLAHHACPECGFYNGKRVFRGRFFKKQDKVEQTPPGERNRDE
jgi:hypothetical protein